ncbi:P-loop containing nucleoside triphosphate hydrolase protein [Exophiala viscosa]|uniref:P-loop containing nucleoside triphosphate hydrolase protein n=1 Tax=Exophiala viscosa TaxID=2486360 RepID=A0AAN6E5K7_9EURO|nr:P-loop containing nucleoside triphosphate hydrolase protein [Exophiala viscosa]
MKGSWLALREKASSSSIALQSNTPKRDSAIDSNQPHSIQGHTDKAQDLRWSLSPSNIYLRDLTVAVHWREPAEQRTGILSLLPQQLARRQLATKTILDGVSADIVAGSLTAIVGGSGSGKTTLLDTISQRVKTSRIDVSGSVYYNTSLLSFHKGTKAHINVPYALQDDVLLPQLTVRETLTYAAALRLPSSVTHKERSQRVNHILEDLGLAQCADTRIGDNLHKGCSGGERRRTTIAIQLLTDSSVLFLDEPTTGLDAAAAFQLVKVLRRLAHTGRTIVMTIHQPRSEMWELIDNLIVMSQGKTAYSGSKDACLGHFEQAGHEIPLFVNPFEFVMDITAIDNRTRQLESKSRARTDALTRLWKQKAAQLYATQPKENPDQPSWDTTALFEQSNHHVSVMQRTRVLTLRTWKVTCRDRLGVFASIIEAITMGVVTGWIFYDVGSDLSGIRSREGAMWSAVGLQGYLVLIFETYRLTNDIKVFDRERREGVSSALAFVASRRMARALLEDIPVPLIYSTLLYFMAGFRHDAVQFSVFFALVVMLHYAAVNVATICVALSRNFQISSLIANTIYTAQSMACGFFINTLEIAIWLRWTKWISYLFYAFGALCVNEFAGHVYDCPSSLGTLNSAACKEYDGDFILQSLNIPHTWLRRKLLWSPILATSAFTVLFLFIAILVLHFNHNEVQVSRQVGTDNDYLAENVRLRDEQAKRMTTVTLQQISLGFEQKRILRKNNYRPVVSNVSAVFQPGALNVILGPSGSGKTSLLNCMARRVHDTATTKWHQTGEMLFNGASVSGAVLRSASSYVVQDDEGLLAFLTVRETLHYAALMRLPKWMSATQQIDRAESLIANLGLKQCADTMVGNELCRGISGGERRRLSIAIQILADPLVLFLDEPTSGLDTVTAASTIDVLQGLASEGRTIIFTIHQPRSEWLKRFETVLLLGKGGEVAYTGPTSSMLDHFQRLGHECPQHQNPADFVLDLVSQQYPRFNIQASESITQSGAMADSQTTLCAPASPTKLPTLLLTQIELADFRPDLYSRFSIQASETSTHLGTYAREPLGFARALSLLLRRELTNITRQPVLAMGRVSLFVGVALILICYATPLKHDYYSVQSRMGCVQQITALYFVGMLNAIALYPAQRELFYREDEDDLYSLEAFFVSYSILEIPIEILSALLFGVVTVLGVGFPRTPSLVFIFAFNAFCVVNCGESLAILLLTFISHAGMAVSLCCILISISVHLTGIIAITIPGFLGALNYVSPLKWLIGNITPYSLRGVTFTCTQAQRLPNGRCPIETGQQVLKLYQQEHNAPMYLAILAGVTVGYRLLAYMVLKARRTRWRELMHNLRMTSA